MITLDEYEITQDDSLFWDHCSKFAAKINSHFKDNLPLLSFIYTLLFLAFLFALYSILIYHTT